MLRLRMRRRILRLLLLRTLFNGARRESLRRAMMRPRVKLGIRMRMLMRTPSPIMRSPSPRTLSLRKSRRSRSPRTPSLRKSRRKRKRKRGKVMLMTSLRARSPSL